MKKISNISFGLTISPNGKELFFVKSFGGRDTLQIYHSRKIKGKWQKPILASFSDRKYRQIDPSFSPDRQTLLFNSLSKTENSFDIYFTRRTKSNDIYVSYFINKSYQKAVLLDKTINTEGNESNPYISPNEEFLLFFADYKSGFGDTDLYISFRKQNNWSLPINLGDQINSKIGEFCPSIDFKNKLFLFSRTEVVNGKRIDNIYTYPLKSLQLKKLKKIAVWD